MTLAAAPISPTPVQHHRFSVEQYHRMIQAGVLTEDDRVQLLNGEIVDRAPIGREHSGRVNRLLALLRSIDQDKAIISVQNPIHLSDNSEPEPDLAVLRFRSDYYSEHLPRPADVLLLIEVADSSLDFDRQIKIPLYARASIPEVWLVKLADNSLEVFRDPFDGRYRQTQIFKRPAAVAPAAFPSASLKMDDLFPD